MGWYVINPFITNSFFKVLNMQSYALRVKIEVKFNCDLSVSVGEKGLKSTNQSFLLYHVW